MARLDKSFKKHVDSEVQEASYVTRQIGIRILIGIIIFGVLCFIGTYTWKYFATNADREIFKQSVSYNEGKLDDLAKYKLEITLSDDPIEKAAIQEYIVSVYANFDESKIENDELRQFLEDCRSGKYNAD